MKADELEIEVSLSHRGPWWDLFKILPRYVAMSHRVRILETENEEIRRTYHQVMKNYSQYKRETTQTITELRGHLALAEILRDEALKLNQEAHEEFMRRGRK